MAAARLEHRRAGSGEPLVAIHGIGSSWQVWKPVLPALERDHDVLALSLPGYGKSPPLDGEPTVPALADAVERAMDEACLETAHLAGNSMGGWIAALLAVRGRARTVTAISPAGLWTRKEFVYSRRSLRRSRRGAELIAPVAHLLTATAPVRTLLFLQTYGRPWRLDPADAAYAIRVFAASPSLPRTLDWIERGYEMPRGLERIDCPFRVLWGTWDRLLPVRQAKRWGRIVPGAEVRILPRLGHAPMSDDPDLVAREILETARRAPRPREAAQA